MQHVVVFGVFDVLHPGHLYFLKQAKKYGHLTVVVSRDERVALRKKYRPFLNEITRLEIVRSIRWVDSAMLGDRVGRWKILHRLKPDIICVGYDQNVDVLKNYNLPRKPRVIRIRPWKAAQYSSTKLKCHLYA